MRVQILHGTLSSGRSMEEDAAPLRPGYGFESHPEQYGYVAKRLCTGLLTRETQVRPLSYPLYICPCRLMDRPGRYERSSACSTHVRDTWRCPVPTISGRTGLSAFRVIYGASQEYVYKIYHIICIRLNRKRSDISA